MSDVHRELECINCTDSPCHPHPLLGVSCSRGTRGCDVPHGERAASAGADRPTPLSGRELAEKHGFKPHGLEPARAWIGEALNRLDAGDDPDSARPLLRQALVELDEQRRERATDERVDGYTYAQIRDELNAHRKIYEAVCELREANDRGLGLDRPRPDIAWRNVLRALDELSMILAHGGHPPNWVPLHCASPEKEYADEGRSDLSGSDARAAKDDEAAQDAQGAPGGEGRPGERTDEADVAGVGTVTDSSGPAPLSAIDIIEAHLRSALEDLEELRRGR